MTEDNDPQSAGRWHSQGPQPAPAPKAAGASYAWPWILIAAAVVAIAVAGLATGYQPPWITLHTAADGLGEEHLNKCVSQAFDRIGHDVPLSRLKLSGNARVPTDDDELYDRLLAVVRPLLRAGDAPYKADDLFVQFLAYFHPDMRPRRIFVISVICDQDFGSPDNSCRNRNYYFFSRRTPEEIADIVLSDITRTEVTLRHCEFQRASRALEPTALERGAEESVNR